MLLYQLKLSQLKPINKSKQKINLQYIVNNDSLDTLKILYELGLLNMGKIMSKACGNNSIKVCKWVHSIDPNLLRTGNDCPMRWASENGYFDIVKWLYKKSNKTIDVAARNNYAFRNACKNGHIEIAQWIYKKLDGIHTIDLSFEDYQAFVWASEFGHLDIIEWLHSIMEPCSIYNLNIDRINTCFKLTCKNGNKDTAKWLLKKYPDINIHETDDYSFHFTCLNGHIKVAKWLYKLDNNIVDYVNMYVIFKYLVINGHLGMLKWLYPLIPNIMDIDYKEFLFRKACINNKPQIAEWLIGIGGFSVRHNNDSSFKKSCKNECFDMIRWFVSKYSFYSAKIVDTKLVEFSFKN